MSTSISKDMSLRFVGNVLFEIHVRDQTRIEHYDHGYAFI